MPFGNPHDPETGFSMNLAVDFAMIRSAASRLAPVIRETPLLNSPQIDAIAGRRVLVKAECLQHTGSFKFRGGWAAISALPDHLAEAGVIAYSSGNHAQGVALAARMHAVPAVIIMPSDAPPLKIERTRALGAEVVLYHRATDDRDAIGGKLAAAMRLHLIRPFDDPEVIAGQGSVGIEIAAQAAALGTRRGDVLVCCGGGGLTSGIALALAELAPGLRVRPVEPEGFDDVGRSLMQGERQHNPTLEGSLCDAILTPAPGRLTLPIMSRHCGPGLSVTDEEALRAVALAHEHLRIVLEPGGAVALAAALFRPDQVSGDTVTVVASGGNIDPALLERALSGNR